MLVNSHDPAFNPDRKVLGSETLGSIATGADSFATELSKLGNGALLSLAVLSGMPDSEAAKYLKHNVDVTTEFQNHLLAAKPTAATAGKWGALADAALLTTPIWGTSFSKAVVTGLAGAGSSILADKGSNPEAPTRKELASDLATTGIPLGLLGAGVGNAIVKSGVALEEAAKPAAQFIGKHIAPNTSRSLEAGAEGTDPENYMPAEGFKDYLMRRMAMPGDETPVTNAIVDDSPEGMRG